MLLFSICRRRTLTDTLPLSKEHLHIRYRNFFPYAYLLLTANPIIYTFITSERIYNQVISLQVASTRATLHVGTKWHWTAILQCCPSARTSSTTTTRRSMWVHKTLWLGFLAFVFQSAQSNPTHENLFVCNCGPIIHKYVLQCGLKKKKKDYLVLCDGEIVFKGNHTLQWPPLCAVWWLEISVLLLASNSS